MRYTSILAATAGSLVGLVPSAAALIITPEMMPETVNAKSVSASLDSVTVFPQCYGCPFIPTVKELEDGRFAIVASKSRLNFEFAIERDNLQINNVTVFPLEAVSDDFRPVLSQVLLGAGVESTDAPVDFSLEAQIAAGESPVDEVIEIDFTVLGLAGVQVNSQSVHIKLVRTSGVLSIEESEMMPFDPLKSEAEMCDTARNQQLCKLRAAIHQRFRQMMEAARHRTSNIKDWMKTHAAGNKPRPCPGAMRPHGDRYGGPHRHGGPHHRGFRFSHWLAMVIKTFIIPAALGVVAGIGVSLIGMVVGRMIVLLWVYVVRGGRRGNVDNIRVIEVEIEEGEKSGLMEVTDEEAPPAYMDEVVIIEQEKQ